MRHFWFFTADDGGRPHFPAGVVPRKAAYVHGFELVGETAGHAHLKLGAILLPDARLEGDYAMHYHHAIQYGGAWHVVTFGAPDHDHEISGQPDWWFMCALIRNADVAACATDPSMYPVAEIVEGELSTEDWDAETVATWAARMENGLYLSMPDGVSNDDRLVEWLKGVSGKTGSERGYRCPGES